ncbi:hypothetical protein M9H77_05896 [Catharanthus roseus]|uniref:Uncharacterized protein n=1 Tax=Catharanthus roseus TaxID=4058 RepID=A0ACC0BQK8_CATRO|nr:hypothetical protein M9H77_05896 [Catharanthus roseus]
MLNDGRREEGTLRERSDDVEKLQELKRPRNRVNNGMWQVSKVVEQHNHKLHPSMSRFMLLHRSLSSNMKRKLEMHDTARLRPSKSVRILEVQAGGWDKLGCLLRDCKNYVQKERRLNIEVGDADCCSLV